MKRNISQALAMITGSLVLLLGGVHCGKSEKADMEIARELIRTLDKIPGLSIKTGPANRTAVPSGQGRYLITLKDPDITFDISGLNIGVSAKDTKIPISAKEIVFQYGPNESYLELVSVKDIYMVFSSSGPTGAADETKNNSPLPGMAAKMSIGNVSFKNYDISPCLDTKATDLMELVIECLRKNPSSESRVEQIAYEINFLSRELKKISLHMNMEKIEGRQKALADAFVSLYRKGGQIPDFSKALKKAEVLFDLEMNGSLFKVSVKENENLLGEGTIDIMSLSYFLKPDETRAFFIYGFDWDFKNLKLSIPGNKEIEMLGQVNELGMKLSLENLSAAFVQAYFGLVKKNMEMSAALDKEKLRQQQMTMGFTIASEFMKSKPVIKFSLSPFKHRLGELEAQFDFQFCNFMAPPQGKAVVKIPQLEAILLKLKEDILSPKTLEFLSGLVTKYVRVDEKGDGTVTFEIKADQPGKFFLNDKLLR